VEYSDAEASELVEAFIRGDTPTSGGNGYTPSTDLQARPLRHT
jgi:hypothetical protein